MGGSNGGPRKTGRPNAPRSGRLGSASSAMRQAQPYIDASWQLLGGVGLGSLAGWWLDRRFGTRPWLLVTGALLGMVSGMLSFWRTVQRLAEKQPKRVFEIRDLDDADRHDGESEERRRPPPPEGFDLSRPNGRRGVKPRDEDE